MSTFQRLLELIGTVGTKYALLGGLYLIFVGVFVPAIGRKSLEKKAMNPLKIFISCLSFGAVFIAVALVLCYGFNEGNATLASAFKEILPILMIGVVLLVLICIALFAYWDVIVGKSDEEDKNVD